MTLTQGAIEKMFSGPVYSTDRLINPVLQIIELERRRVLLSDGTNYVDGMLAGNLFNSVVYLEKYSIVKLNMYTLSTSLTRVIFIFDCDVLLPECHLIIGEPTPLPRHSPHHIDRNPYLGVCDLDVSDLGFFDSAIPLDERCKLSDPFIPKVSTVPTYAYADINDLPQTCLSPGPGVLEIICNDSDYLISNNNKPLLLQVYDTSECCICLSDGKNIIFALTPKNLEEEFVYYELDNPYPDFKFGFYEPYHPASGFDFKDELYLSAYPHINSIVKLYNYKLEEFQGHKFIIIFDFVVLETHIPIGNPVVLPTNNTSWSQFFVSQFLMSFPPINLTQQTIKKIFDCNFSYDEEFKPVMQVLSLDETDMVVSDGSYALSFPHQVNLIERFSFDKMSSFSVIKITDYCVNKNSQNPKVVILDIKVILHKMSMIGNPIDLDKQALSLCVSPPKHFNKKNLPRLIGF